MTYPDDHHRDPWPPPAPYGSAPYGQQPYGQQPYGQYPYSGGGYHPGAYGGVPSAPIPGAPDLGAPYGRDPATGEPLSDKSKVAAGLLQIFLGGFGVGRFYIGDSTTGAIMLVLTIVGYVTAILVVGIFIIFAVAAWALVDGIMMLMGNVRDSNGRKLSG